MKFRTWITTAVVLALAVIVTDTALRAENPDNRNTLGKALGAPVRTYFNINNISTLFTNYGVSDIDAQEQNSGFVFPKGSRKTTFFQSGFMWGGKVAGEVRVGGTSYRTGLQGGKILPDTTAEDPDLDKVRIYRVRPDYKTADLSGEVADEGGSQTSIRARYDTDWQEWPWQDGAPFDDKNGNGTYEPNVDVAGFPGADQTLWFVANDLNPGNTTFMYGSNPIGIEIQATIWGYSQQGALGNMLFRKYIIINKSANTIDSMYLSMWSDPDLGNSNDDYAGCDTTLSLGYIYNANATDATYSPLPPPAGGFDLFQGPIVDAPGQTAIFHGRVVQNKRNLPMTAFYYFARGDANVTDPTQGDYEGTLQFYNFFQGKIGKTGEFFRDPNTELQTTFVLTGDPQTRKGWVDGQVLPAGDRRLGLASGPITMAPGDTQEVVLAQIAAGAIPGVDRLSAIGLLKYYDLQAQLAYDNFFDLPIPPPPPSVEVKELDKEIILDWRKNDAPVLATESSVIKGYAFQGYNIYQLPSASASIDQAVRIQTFDINDGIGKIFDQVFDTKTGSVIQLPVQFGNDTYVQRFISIKQDAIRQQPLINGIRYYFAVTAYSYNPNPFAVPNNLENPLKIITVTPHSNNPGVTYGEGSGSGLAVTHSGTADGFVTAKVVDPTVTTGDDYEVYFTERQEIRDANGDWVPAATIRIKSKTAHPDTVTGSSIDIAGVYGVTAGQLQLHFLLNLVSANDAFSDGVSLVFPPGVTILSAPSFEAGGGTIAPQVVGNVINLGRVDHPYTQNGIFQGGEEWDIVVDAPLPIAIDWTIFDDGYLDGPVDAQGTTSITTVGNLSRLAKHWNLRDNTTGVVKLQKQTVIDGTDIFPRRNDIPTNPGLPADPIVDGFQVSVDIGYAAPINYFSIALESPSGLTELTNNSSTTTLDIQNYTVFGGTVSSKVIDNFGVGTDDINELQQDYELRFTGILDTTTIGGRTVIYVASGGSIATIFRGVSVAALGTHPLNPNPGVAQPFLIRIPFEVWNKDKNQQVNLTFRDREQLATTDPFYAWNAVNRMYALIVNSPYDSTQVIQVDGGPDAINALATWVLVMYGTNYNLGDVVAVTYANPIQIGIDNFKFKTTKSTFSLDLAKEQVNKINVFPNPYYGVNTEEINKYQRFVTFSHLPKRAVVRIFNLAGTLVRVLDKNNNDQFLRWNLDNESGLPVASGLYIAFIEMPELGETKTLKLSIIQERQVLDRF